MDTQKLRELSKLIADFDKDELLEGNRMIQDRFSMLQRQVAQRMSVGMNVSFTHKGVTYEGKITKVNRKTVNVLVGGHTNYRISPSLLTVE